METATIENGEAAVWSRVMEQEKHNLSPKAARALLEIRFSKADKARMNHLARKNQEGLLSDKERGELEAYVKVGDVLSLLHLKARKSLKS